MNYSLKGHNALAQVAVVNGRQLLASAVARTGTRYPGRSTSAAPGEFSLRFLSSQLREIRTDLSLRIRVRVLQGEQQARETAESEPSRTGPVLPSGAHLSRFSSFLRVTEYLYAAL